jgi:beta-glucanase (GH16 family)
MHTRYTNLVNRANPKNYTTHPINVDDYNTYSVIVTTEKVQYLINNEVTHEYPNLGIEYQFPFASNAYYVVLSSQLGGDWVGEIDLKGETVYMSIDWVRVYTKK